MILHTADRCEAPDAPPHPFLAPVIARDPTEKGRLAWGMTCAAVSPRRLRRFAATRKALVEEVTGRGLWAWVQWATACAEDEGSLRIAPPPPSACHEWRREQIIPVGAGLFYHCTMMPAPDLKGAVSLAHLRTGFSQQRVTEAAREGQYGRDWQTWVAASGQAAADLAAGALTEEETAHLSPNPAHAGYLRLDGVGRAVTLGTLESLTGDKLRDFYLQPGNWSRERTCWAPAPTLGE